MKTKQLQLRNLLTVTIAVISMLSITHAQTIFLENFEDGTLGAFTNSGTVQTLTWVNTEIRGGDADHSATHTAYFGNPADTSYETGFIEGATITSSAINLTAYAAVNLSFNYFLETEDDNNYDIAQVLISTDNVNYTEIANNRIGLGNLLDQTGVWQSLDLDVSSVAGNPTVYIRFVFNTVDGAVNNYEGFYVDDVKLYDPNVVGFTTSASSGCTPLSITLTNTTTNPDAYFYKWFMKDGTATIYDTLATTINHTYVDNGTYSTKLSAYDSTWAFLGSVTTNIVVSGLSSWEQLYTYPDVACPGKGIDFNAPWGYASYVWDFGDGSPIETIPNSWKNHAYSSQGVYISSVTIKNVCGGADVTLYDTITINSSMPFPSWEALYSWPENVCPNENVSFNAPWGYALYEFNYGDGSPNDITTNSYRNHNYSSTGIYPVSVKVTNYCGNDTLLYDTINVRYLPFSGGMSLNLSPTIVCPGENIYFNAPWGYLSYEWNYGDGNPVDSTSNASRQHNYASVGTYVISVKITQSCGNDTTLYATVNVDSTVAFSVASSLNTSPNPACPFEKINFYGVSGYPTYVWKFGDGTPQQTTSNSYNQHIYTASGIYIASLKVTNLCGNDTTYYDTININNNIPFPSGISYNINSSPSCPGNVNFVGSSGYQFYTWTFGDGTAQKITTTNNISHSYPDTGSYPVSLKITSYCGNDTTFYDTLKVQYQSFPNMSMSFYPTSVCPGENISFNAPWGYVSYLWDFGDGTTATASNYINHTYSSVGQYMISVKMTQLCGNDTTLYSTASIINNKRFPTYISLNTYPNKACPNKEIDFYAPWGYASYQWDFGDGTLDTTTNSYVDYSYSAAGTYPVSLRIFNYCGIDTLLVDTIIIDSNLEIDNWVYLDVWYSEGTSACVGEMVNLYASWDFPFYVWDYGDGSPLDSVASNFMNYSYSSAGTYTASVKIINNCGQDTTLYKSVTIKDNKSMPTWLMLNVNSGPYCPREKINFTAPFGYPQYVWDFGDGSNVDSSSTNQVTRSYANPGTYTASVTVINYCGNDTTLSASITIDNTVPFSWTNINIYPNPICPNQEVLMSTENGYESYFWDFGDGNTAYGSYEANHAYTSLGDYTVSVNITNYCGIDSTFSTSLTVDASTSFPSWMSFWSIPGQICPGEMVTLKAEKGFSNYFWDFGDGDTITTSGASIKHRYESEGNFDASVTINNGCGNSTTLFTTVYVDDNSTVNAPWIYTPNNSYCPSDEVMFLFGGGSGGGAKNYTYSWNFGDGNTGTTVGTGTKHVYDSAGTYTATVIVSNHCGSSEMLTIPVKINNNSFPTLSESTFGTPSNTNIAGCSGDAIVFYFEGSGNNVWDFGDGSFGAATEEIVIDHTVNTVIKHAYSSTGTYNVSLTLTNGCGNSTTDSLSIQVMDNLLVDGGMVIAPPSSAGTYTTCEQINMIAYGGSSYEWDFGDGSTLTTISPTISHLFSEAGNYSINVNITNGCGNSTTFSKEITVSESVGFDVSISTMSNVSCNGGSDGSTAISVSGGQSPYFYFWDDKSMQTDSIATALEAGVYNVTITDDIGCSIDTSITITEASPIILSTTSINSGCGNADGSASVSIVSGGVSPFTYAWSSGGSNTTETNLYSGAYTVTVTDSTNCSVTSIATISDSGSATVSIATITDAICNGFANGSITTNVSGSVSSYLWSNGNTTANITNLTAGTYVLTATNANNCKTVKSATVNNPDALSLKITTDEAECGESNGSATVNVSGGTASYSYLWDSNAGSKITSTATGLSANAYKITVTDANGCTKTSTATVSNGNAPSISINATDVSCYGYADGDIDLTVTGGTTPYTYIWTWDGGGSFVEDLSGLDEGTYTIMIQDASNCWIGTNVVIDEPLLSSSITITDVTCVGGNNGTATVVVSDGYPPYSYLWSTSDTTNSIDSLVIGSYTVQTTDSNGCVINDTAIIEEPTTLSSTLTPTDVSCFGGSDGSIDLIVSNGTSPYTYVWSNGSTTQDVSILSANTYIVTITDNCGASTVDSIEVDQPALLAIAISATDVSCYGGGDGTATTTPSGGTSPYNYMWNNGQTDSNAVGLFPGFHAVNVFDVNGCIASNNITINQPNALSLSIVGSDANCNGGSDGSADLTVTGGTTPYTYSWSNSATTEDLSNVTAGTYTVTITDSCGTTSTNSVTLGEPSVLSSSIIGNNVSCNGKTNGSINLTVSGGTSPYSYLWSTTETVEDISSLSANTYKVTITDACSSVITDSVVINQPAVLTSSISKTNVNCFGTGDGTATVSGTGGTKPYTFSWSNGQTDSIAIGLFPGSYSVNIVDAKGCLTSNLTSITQPSSISTSITNTDVSCNGGNNGSVNLTVTGGTTPYTYLWSDSATTEDLSSLAAGTYSVTVTDSCGATSTNSVTIDEPSVLSSSIAGSDVSCNGNTNGSANLTISGGTSPYSYLWSNTDTIEDISSLSANTYKVTITDACSSVITDSVVINQPAVLTSTASKTNVSCNGGIDGTATVTPSGGTTPYSYFWSNNQTSSTAVSLYPSTYTVNVIDAHGCVANNLVSITEPNKLSITTSVSYVSCNAGSDGSVDLTVTGGTAPYTYSWSNGATTQDLSAITSGTYSVTVTDSCGASVMDSVSITQPGALSIAMTSSDVKCNGGTTGKTIATISGGVLPYVYAWSNGKTTSTVTGLVAGNYYLTVTDNCAISADDSVQIDEPLTLTNTIVKTNVNCYGTGDGTATVIPTGGTLPYTVLWNNNQTDTTAIGLFPGTYSVNVVDANGCLTSNLTTILQPTAISTSISSTDVNCNGASTGSIDLTVSGGTTPYTYLWSNSDTTEDLSNETAGTYTITVTDSCGATSINSVTIDEPSVLSSSVVGSDVSCNGNTNGSANLTISGGTSPYSYIWSNTDSIEDISSLSANTYKVTITDACGSVITDSVVISEPIVLTSTVGKTDVNCNGGVDGTATVTPSGGITPYKYFWSNNQTNPTAVSLYPGTFTVNVIDANGCVANNLVSITEPNTLSISTSVSYVSCNGGSDGNVNLTVSGGTIPYAYTWSNSDTTEDLSGVSAGTYSVTVTDSCGATYTNSVVISEPTALTSSIVGTYVSCNGNADGSANLTVTGGTSPYSYLWSTTDTIEDISSLSVNTYFVTITDACSSVVVDSIVINEPLQLTTTITKTGVACYGDGNGTAKVTASGGTAPYYYLWNTNQMKATISGLFPGNYTVNVTDANGCLASGITTINQPTKLQLTMTHTDATCGNADGSVAVQASGGTTPYTYSWSNADTTSVSSGIVDGNYSVTVTDVNNCSSVDSIAIKIVAQQYDICIVTVDSTSTRNIVVWAKPYMTNIDSIRVYREVPGSGYKHVASVATTELSEYIDVSSGINPQIQSYKYKMSVIDSCGNESALSAYHKTMNLSVTTNTSKNPVLSWDNYEGFGFSYYRILRDTTGEWANFEVIDSSTNTNTQYVDVNAPASKYIRYIVEVVHTTGCTAEKIKNYNTSRSNTAAIAGESGSALTAAITDFTDASFGKCDGTATVEVSGGTPPYTYAWDNVSLQTVTTATDLCWGTYSVTITDSTGIETTVSVNIETNVGIENNALSNNVKIYPNPNRGVFTIEMDNLQVVGNNKVEVYIYNVLGEVIYQSEIHNPYFIVNLKTQPQGIYHLKVVTDKTIMNKQVIVE